MSDCLRELMPAFFWLWSWGLARCPIVSSVSAEELVSGMRTKFLIAGLLEEIADETAADIPDEGGRCVSLHHVEFVVSHHDVSPPKPAHDGSSPKSTQTVLQYSVVGGRSSLSLPTRSLFSYFSSRTTGVQRQ